VLVRDDGFYHDNLFNGKGAASMVSNLETTKKAYELFKQGDISTLVNDIVDASCTWISPGPRDKLPWAGNFKGPQEIADFFARVAQNLDLSNLRRMK
jgi:uncharacterized protein